MSRVESEAAVLVVAARFETRRTRSQSLELDGRRSFTTQLSSKKREGDQRVEEGKEELTVGSCEGEKASKQQGRGSASLLLSTRPKTVLKLTIMHAEHKVLQHQEQRQPPKRTTRLRHRFRLSSRTEREGRDPLSLRDSSQPSSRSSRRQSSSERISFPPLRRRREQRIGRVESSSSESEDRPWTS